MSSKRIKYSKKSIYSPQFKAAYEKLVDRSGGPNACHSWIGLVDEEGHGIFEYEGKKYRADLLTLCMHDNIPYDEALLDQVQIHHHKQLRPVEEIQRVHDLLEGIVNSGQIETEAEYMGVVSALDTLCWALGSNSPNNNLVANLPRLTQFLNDVIQDAAVIKNTPN